MTSLVVSLLAERPEAELRDLQAKARSELGRLEVELAQIDEALAKQARRGASRASARTSRPGSTRRRIVEAVRERNHPVRPAEIIATLREQGWKGQPGGIHNHISRLVRDGELVKVGDGQYRLASRNGSGLEPSTGPTEHATTEPLLTATGPQEAS